MRAEFNAFIFDVGAVTIAAIAVSGVVFVVTFVRLLLEDHRVARELRGVSEQPFIPERLPLRVVDAPRRGEVVQFRPRQRNGR